MVNPETPPMVPSPSPPREDSRFSNASRALFIDETDPKEPEEFSNSESESPAPPKVLHKNL